jgi:stearoyl-CoA desaturase (Delta-9 desaturase)
MSTTAQPPSSQSPTDRRPQPPSNAPGTHGPGMGAAERYANLAGVVVPFAGVIVAIVLLWDSFINWTTVIVMLAMYLISGFGVTVGFHRLLTHRSFQTYPWLERAFAIAGSLSVQGSVLDWVADHRKHHAHTDEEGDPHSPHVGHGHGLRGFIHAHCGWLMETQGQADWKKYARDLYDDPAMRKIGRRFPLWVVLSLLIPTVLCWALEGFTAKGALEGFLWAGLVRIFLVHHITWSINSICHIFGQRRFDIEDKSTNVWWLAPFSFGEAWHHNHHAFPRSAFHGLKWYELDFAGILIRGLKSVKLAWNVVEISPERQAQKLVHS